MVPVKVFFNSFFFFTYDAGKDAESVCQVLQESKGSHHLDFASAASPSLFSSNHLDLVTIIQFIFFYQYLFNQVWMFMNGSLLPVL